MPTEGKKYFYIASLEKGLRVLELLADKEALTVTAVAAALGLNRAGSHRFLATLRDLGYVEKNDAGQYQLTHKVLELGMKFANRFEIRRLARPYMQRLAVEFKETVNLGYWDGEAIIHLDKIDSLEILRMDSGIGTRAPAYCTGLGKSILAFLPEEEREAFLQEQTFAAVGPNTITSPDALRLELGRIRQRGYAVDNEELTAGLRCVAAPILNFNSYPVYAISVAGPVFRMTPERMKQIQIALREACARLSTALGRPGGDHGEALTRR